MMSLLNKILEMVVRYSIYLSLGASCLAYGTFLFIGAEPDLSVISMVFLLTFSMYNINHITDLKEDSINSPERSKTISGSRNFFIILSVMTFTVSMYLSYHVGVLPIFMAIVLLAILYSVRLLPGDVLKFKRLKDKVFLKNITIAITWSMTVVLLPAFSSHILDTAVFSLSIFIFFRLLINTIFFDIRDTEGDSKSGIITVPILLGTERTKILLHSLNISASIFLLYFVISGKVSESGYFLILSTFYTFFYILFSDRNFFRSGIGFDLVGDGEFIFFGILAFLGTSIL